ncbi:LOW QUALITY PROTEIN: ubiquitin conjugation factor E4 B [Drosophila busckii]|uniref:LOW QUALITY PROTEIN: ubiquitin conjugation factor E4 B n=1 Tax=Drosophila busckii TaxID=30019 RepID=UPI001432EF1A|nr:LOW QUALITY PROTEIN: ubiquitin conjugation factor E4 B [Drosophila busckii]
MPEEEPPQKRMDDDEQQQQQQPTSNESGVTLEQPAEQPTTEYVALELTAEEMRARRLRTLAARSNVLNAAPAVAAATMPVQELTPRSQKNESRLLREAPTSSSSMEPSSLVDKMGIVWSELGNNKPDMDVEMKSMTPTPVQDVEMTPAPEPEAPNRQPAKDMLPPAAATAPLVPPAEPPTLKNVEEQQEQILSRLLDATWNEFGSGSIICAQTASLLEQYPDMRFDFESIASNVLLEIVFKYFNDEVEESSCKLSGDAATTTTATAPISAADDKEFSSAKKIKSDDTEVQEILANAVASSSATEEEQQRASATPSQTEVTPSDACAPCVVPSMLSIVTTSKHNAMLYLLRCFNESQKAAQSRIVTIALKSIMRIVVLVLTDQLQPNLNYQLDQSTLLELMYMERVPEAFLHWLIGNTYKERVVFDTIFGQLLRGLFSGMQRNICSSKINMQQVDWLYKLVEVKVENVRPIADLVGRQANFIPPICTKIPGREIVKCSFLGPFLSVSLFAEENVKFAEYTTKNKLDHRAINRLRWDLMTMRGNMYRVFHSLCLNSSSRVPTLEYVSHILRHNDRRVQFASDEKLLARDGFVINLMSVLQMLSVKIKLDRVEPHYHYYKNCYINIEQDTKIRFSEEEYKSFLAREHSQTVDIPNLNFQTHCWFLTLQAHHLGYLPAIQRYRQKVRAIKELQKLIDELDRTKPHWVNSRYAHRNNQFKERWEKQLRKLNRSKTCSELTLLCPFLLENCTRFYSSVCEYMLYQFEGRSIEGPFISKLPIQQLKPTDAFSALPEWYIDDIAEFILFAMQHATDIHQHIDHSIITWLLTCVCASHLIKNPYVTAKLVEVMFVFSLKPANSINTAMWNHELAQNALVSALMRFYVDVETTGQSTEFYDKFTIR